MDVTGKKTEQSELVGQDPITTLFVRRHLQRLYEQDADFKALATAHGLNPSSLISVRDGKDGVGGRLRPKYAKLMGFSDEWQLIHAALRAYVMEHVVGASPGVDGLGALEGEAHDAATVKVLSFFRGPAPRERVLTAIESEPEREGENDDVGAALMRANRRAGRSRPTRR